METNGENDSNGNSIPTELIDRIFTFLPIKNAVSSSVIAKPFKNSWLYTRNLCFDRDFWINCLLRDRDEIAVINNILSKHLGEKLYSFHLYIHEPTKYSPSFMEWIQHAASKGLEELELHLVQPRNEVYFHLNSDFIDVETLRVLKLKCCELYLTPNLKGLRFLKSLSLTRIRVVPQFVKTLFSSLVALESLALKNCSSIGEVTIKGSDKFKTLLIRNCKDIVLVKIDTPSITTFHYTGEINKIQFVGLIRLKDVILDFYATKGFQHIRKRENLMEALRNVQTLSINHILLEGLSSRYMDFEHKEIEVYLSNLKELQLVRYGQNFINAWDILNFVKRCPQIERLFLDLGDYAMEPGIYWNLVAKEKFENCQIVFPQLKLLKVTGFIKLELEEKLLNFFLSNAPSLESLIIIESKNNREGLMCDAILFSKVPAISIYGLYKDDSSEFPRHRVLKMHD